MNGRNLRLRRRDFDQRNRTRNSFRVAILNVATLREKEEEMVLVMKVRKLEIFGFCETRTKGKLDKVIHENYRLICSGNDTGSGGVGIMITPELSDRVENINFKSERILSVTIKLEQKRVRFIQVYVPQQGRTTAEKEAFYEELQEVYELNDEGAEKIVMGDWNGHVGVERVGIERVIGAFSAGTKNAEGERVIDFCVANHLTIMNTFYKHQESHKWTWYRYNRERGAYTDKSMIDLFVSSNKKLFKDVKAIPSLSGDSDHRLVLAKLHFTKPKSRASKKQTRYALENLKDHDCRTKFEDGIRAKFPTEDRLENMEEAWTTFKDSFHEVAKREIKTKTSKRTKKKITAWWTEEVKTTVMAKMKAFRKWMKTRDREDHGTYKVLRNMVKTVKEMAKEESWNNIGNDLENEPTGTRKLIYKLAKAYRKGQTELTYAVKDKNGELLVEPDKIAERWKEYFQELLNVPDNIQEGAGIDDGERDDNTDEISTEEVKRELKRMKNGKATGEDDLPIEIIKAGGEDAVDWLCKLFNCAYREEKTPKDWQRAVISPIYKKGDKQDCNNYRGISLLSHVGKLYERIIERRLRSQVEDKIGDWQYGFRPGRSTLDLIFALKMLLEKSWEYNEERYLVFIDLEKAFDRINREQLWNVLKERRYNINHKLIRVIQSMYENCEARVKNRDGPGNWFTVKTGVKQGAILSPLLFIIYMDSCFREICTGEDEETFAYADDGVTITKTREQLQEAVNIWNEVLIRKGMKINKIKTEVMMVGRIRQECNIYIEEQQLKQIEDFKYLGVIVNEKSLQEKEIINRITQYNNNFSLLYPLLKDKHVPVRSKLAVYTSILRPILIYGSEAWILTSKTKSKIQAAEMKSLRLIRGVTKFDRMRNEDIRRDLGVDYILDIVERGRLRWFGHVKRMDEERYARKYLEWRPRGRRPVGRPRKRWMEGVAEAAEKRGKSVTTIERERFYDNRGAWRNFVNS